MLKFQWDKKRERSLNHLLVPFKRRMFSIEEKKLFVLE